MVGDGSFGFNAMELDTAARHGVPIVTVIMNNQRMERRLGTARRAPLRAHGRRVRRRGLLRRAPREIGPALDAAFVAKAPSIVNVMVDPAAEYFAGRVLS